MRGRIISTIVLVVFLVLAGCSGKTTEDRTKPAVTDFGRMLGLVPYSYLEKQDIWYSNPGTVKARYGLGDLNSAEDIRQLENDKGAKFLDEFSALPVAQSYSQNYWLEPLTGWNWINIDRAVFNEIPPPAGFSVIEGNFDEELIGERLTEQGYAKSEYGSYTYYHINDDMQINLKSELGSLVLSQLNRVAVLEDTLVVAPATGSMTGVLDAMMGKETAISAVPACQAIAASLGEIQGAVLIRPDRIIQTNRNSQPVFDLPEAEKWGKLHDYELLGTGYMDDGTKRYWIISLYYDNKKSAAADAGELESRLKSYSFYTHVEQKENLKLTSIYEVGKPEVYEYGGGATLTVKCRYLPENAKSSPLFTLIIPGHDLLFAMPDPVPYLASTAASGSCAPAGYSYIDYSGRSSDPEGKFGLTKTVWGPYSMYLVGQTSLTEGTWVRAKLYKDGTAVEWWPDNYGQHIRDGKWEFHVKSHETNSPETRPALDEIPEFESGYSLRIWSMNNPESTTELRLDPASAAEETRIPDSDRAVKTDLEGSKWQLISLNGAPVKSTTITLEFSQGEATGNSGCNYYGGRYLERTPNIVQIYGITITLLGCSEVKMAQEEAYIQYLSKTICYRLEDNKLELYDVITNEKRLVFERQK